MPNTGIIQKRTMLLRSEVLIWITTKKIQHQHDSPAYALSKREQYYCKTVLFWITYMLVCPYAMHKLKAIVVDRPIIPK